MKSTQPSYWSAQDRMRSTQPSYWSAQDRMKSTQPSYWSAQDRMRSTQPSYWSAQDRMRSTQHLPRVSTRLAPHSINGMDLADAPLSPQRSVFLGAPRFLDWTVDHRILSTKESLVAGKDGYRHMQENTGGHVQQDIEKLAVRVVTGTLMAGHGAQKLFGAFEGPGLKGTAGFMEMMGLRPGHYWGLAAALSEFGGGTLTALGLLSPLGPIGTLSAMGMATAKAHWGKPIWVGKGGAERPAIYAAAALAVSLTGPGRFSLDAQLGIQVPRWLALSAALAAAGTLAYGISSKPVPQQAPAAEAPAPAADTEQHEVA